MNKTYLIHGVMKLSFRRIWKELFVIYNHEYYPQINELKATVDGLEKERDFYFGKLRDIEVICQEMEEQQNAPIVQKILDILYATEVHCYFSSFTFIIAKQVATTIHTIILS